MHASRGGITLAVLFLSVADANAWDPAGHMAIGEIAEPLLTVKARKAVANVLGMPLAAAGNWADCARSVRYDGGALSYVPSADKPACRVFEEGMGKGAMVSYAQRNWNGCVGAKECFKQYQYASVAIQHPTYSSNYVGAGGADIVHAASAAIAKLKGEGVSAPFNFATDKEALLVLVNLVGDLHQPLRMGAVYLNANNVPYDPDSAGLAVNASSNTQGGFMVGIERIGRFGVFWDQLVPFNGRASLVLAPQIKLVQRSQGGVKDWVGAWSNESLEQARAAFEGVTFVASTHEPRVRWMANFKNPSEYLSRARQIQGTQVARAGVRLAEVLNDIYK